MPSTLKKSDHDRPLAQGARRNRCHYLTENAHIQAQKNRRHVCLVNFGYREHLAICSSTSCSPAVRRQGRPRHRRASTNLRGGRTTLLCSRAGWQVVSGTSTTLPTSPAYGSSRKPTEIAATLKRSDGVDNCMHGGLLGSLPHCRPSQAFGSAAPV